MADERKSEDRRKHPRRIVDIGVEEISMPVMPDCYVKDISEGGVRLEARVDWERPTKLDPGTRLKIRFKPWDSEPPVEVYGEVVWFQGRIFNYQNKVVSSLGLRFIDLDDYNRRAIAKLALGRSS